MFEKSLIVLMIGCFLLGMATKAEVEGVKEEAEKELVKSEANPEMGAHETLIKLSEEPALYKAKISQVTPQSGIITGGIIAYGHYIKPPYKIEIRNDTMLFVNGIQILPQLPSELEIEEKRRGKIRREEKYSKADSIAKPYQKRLHSLFDEMDNIYKLLEPKVGRVKAADSIYKLVEAETLIVEIDTNFVGEDDCSFSIVYFMPGYSERPDDLIGGILLLEGGNSLSGYTSSSGAGQNLKKKRDYVKYRKDFIEERLKENYVILCSSFNKAMNLLMPYYFWMVLDVLKNNDLTPEDKIGKLGEITPLAVEKSRKEIIYNFDPSEWPERK